MFVALLGHLLNEPPLLGVTVSLSSKKTRVLHVIGAMNRGGAESFVMFVYRKIDRTQFSFDFLVNDEGDYDEEIRSLGGSLYYIPRFVGSNVIEYLRGLSDFFSCHHDYDAVHVHIGSTAVFVIRAAHKYHLYAIAHSHNTHGKFSPSELAFRLVSYPTRYLADYYLACSVQAGKDRFGDSITRSNRFSVINNGIDLHSYRFSNDVRERYRCELGISGSAKAVCHIGRFVEQKNHSFLVRAFRESLAKEPNQILFLLGRGPLENDTRALVERLGIGDRVRFLGVRQDVSSLLMAMDLFVFPSKWEGLGIVTIEAQASGLPCLLSPELPDIAVCTPYAEKLSGFEDALEWAEKMDSTPPRTPVDRIDGVRYVSKAGFDIADTVGALVRLYTHRP